MPSSIAELRPTIIDETRSRQIIAQTGVPTYINTSNAPDTIFRIDTAGSSGSGVLIVLPDGKLSIVTSKHVVSDAHKEEELILAKDNGEKTRIKGASIIVVPELDIAFLVLSPKQLESLRSRSLPSSISVEQPSIGTKVFVAGFPLDDSQATAQGLRVTEGNIQTISRKMVEGGYQLGYSSKTYVGMSGGGVFSSNGALIGIHGRGEAMASSDVNKTGTNFAVPISLALEWYRKSHMPSMKEASLGAASISILSADYPAALSNWRRILQKHPESFVAGYNVKCLESRVHGNPLNLSRFRPLGETWDEKMNVIEWARQRDIRLVDMYLADPLVKLALSGSDTSGIHPSLMPSYKQALSAYLGNIHQMDGGICDLFVLTKKSLIEPLSPLQPSMFVRPYRGKWPNP